MNQPEQYSKNNWFQSEQTTRLLQNYLDPKIWNRGKSILEIGMGDSMYTTEVFLPVLPQNITRYVASDISEEMVEFSKQKYGTKFPKIEFMTMDCQTANFPASLINQFDFVVSFNSFHWFTNARKAFDNIFKALKPGGEVVATFFNINPMDDVFFNLSQHPKWGVYGHSDLLSDFINSDNHEESWLGTFKNAGFVNIENHIEYETVVWGDNFEEFFLSLDPIFVRIPEDQKEAYLRDYYHAVKTGKGFSVIPCGETEKMGVKLVFEIMFLRATKPLT